MVNKITSNQNNRCDFKYISRSTYYGKLINIDFVSGAMILVLKCYVASEFFGGSVTVRLYVPSDMENKIRENIWIGEDYLVIAAPYRIRFQKNYAHRVDLLINIFTSVI